MAGNWFTRFSWDQLYFRLHTCRFFFCFFFQFLNFSIKALLRGIWKIILLTNLEKSKSKSKIYFFFCIMFRLGFKCKCFSMIKHIALPLEKHCNAIRIVIKVYNKGKIKTIQSIHVQKEILIAVIGSLKNKQVTFLLYYLFAVSHSPNTALFVQIFTSGHFIRNTCNHVSSALTPILHQHID